VIGHRPGEVGLQAATPAPGFRAEIEKTGPDEVEVEFTSDTEKIEVSAEWKKGQLEIEVSTETEGDE
jgi:hypothetical protein